MLQNDTNAAGDLDAAELRLVSVSESTTADLEIQGRTVSYSATAALRAQITPENPVVVDTFTYLLEDGQGLTSEAIVTVTIRLPPDPTDCLDEGRLDCSSSKLRWMVLAAYLLCSASCY